MSSVVNRNLLITSSGAKVLLVRAFKMAAETHGVGVFTADLKSKCATSLVSDQHLTMLPLRHADARQQILEIVEEHKIGLIIPTRDGELRFFAEMRDELIAVGARLLCCSSSSLEAIQDKASYSDSVEQLGYKAVPRVSPMLTNWDYPLFTRPIAGASGRGAYKINSASEMPPQDTWSGRLFHPFIEATEYSIDILMGLEPGAAIQCAIRERMEVVGGEAKVSKIVSQPELEREAMSLATHLGLVGHNVMQAFVTDDGKIYHIETNPRFGGASNLSIQAGLDSPARILDICFGRDELSAMKPRKIKVGATMYRYSDDFIELPSA